MFKKISTPGSHSAMRWWLTILLSIILLGEIGLAWAAELDSTLGEASPAPWKRLVSAGGRVGWAAVQSVATANYRAYDLEDLLPLEQVYLPKIALPRERHPSLLFGENEKDLIRQRTLQEPYSWWWDIVLQRAQTGLATDLAHPRLEESQRAYAAKSCAFAYVITGELPFLEKAREGLLHISPPPAVTTPEGGRTGQGWGDWVRASALMLNYCVAYDLVAQDLSPEDRGIITEKIAAETDQLYRGLKFAPPNNHKTLMAVAVGTAALTIPSYGRMEAQAWLDAAMVNMRSGLAQIDGDGSYREGIFYAGYIARLLFPFALYLRRTTGEDLFRHRRVEDLVQWVLKIGKPDGSIPLFDDTWQKNRTYLPILVGQSRLGGVARWIYESGPREASDQVNEVEFICAFDDRVPPEHPPWERTAFFPDGGMAIFGDDWSSQGIYLLLLGEEDRALASSHEHIDPGNFVLHAYGQDLIIDSGYGPRGRISTSRPWHLSAEGHNMLLVDGRGPNANPFSQDQLGGHLVHCFRSTPVSGAAVKARYGGTDIQRTVHFLGQRYFLVFDQLASPEPHDYELVLHGMGRAQREEPERVTWSSGTGKLLVEFLSPEQSPPQISLRTGQHTPSYGEWETHTYARARKPRMRETHFTTLLLPQSAGSFGLKSVDLPVLSIGPAQAREISGETLKDSRHLVITTDGQEASVEGVTTDGLACVTGFGAAGERQFFVNAQGTFYAHRGDTCYISDRPVTITMLTGRDHWAGYVDAGQEEVVIRMETDFDPGHVRFGEFPIDYQYGEGKVRLRLKGSGPLELGAGPPLVFTPQRSRERFPFLERLIGQQEPMARWEELSPEQRFLVETQALALTRKRLNEPIQETSTKMGLGPKGLERAFGLVTGLADQAYDPQNWARLNLPQHLLGQTTLGGATLSYAQEGHLTAESWRVERLEGQLSGGSWGSVKVGHYSPFPEVTHRTLRLDVGKFSLATGLEKMEAKQRHQFSTSYLGSSSNWGLDGYTQDGDDDYGLNLFWRGSSLTAEASQHRGPGASPGRRLFLSHRSRIFSPQAELWDPGSSGETELRISWASAPFRSITWEFSSLLDHLPHQPLLGEMSNTVSFRGRTNSSQINLFYQEGLGSRGWVTYAQDLGISRWNVGADFRQWGRPFVTEEKLSLLWNGTGWASLSTSLSHRHHSPLGDDALNLALSGHLRPEKATRIHIRLEGGTPQSRLTAWGLGIDRWGQVSWGGSWTHLQPRGIERRSKLSIHGGWTGDERIGVRGRAELELSSENRIEAYQIEFRQEGLTWSPGLLLSRDPLTGVRNDGFLQFRF